ncbi:hypothetical protein C5749_06690 [Sphingobacterium gobiense]|uniref:DUF1697 domain-containing protein n=2 Tax=Sphingobacterium gobiense TaxID=1382456 RepID=A0A2S9JW20_9SPHI|nr:hypothetical protein C5749_06690 [Sphingobacterium gobiense]
MGVFNADNQFCAFLRGVNVKGTNMKMAEVCSVFKRAGMQNVSSVLASGNILFSSERRAQELKQTLEKAMSDHFSYEAYLFVKSRQEIETIFREIPFETDSRYHIYGFVGVDGVAKMLMSEFDKSKKALGEAAQLVDCNFYWKVPKGNTLDSEFGKILGIKNLKSSFTSRNINTFEKVLKKM